MSENSFCQKLKSLSTADRWLLGLCVLPLFYFFWLLYWMGIVRLFNASLASGGGFGLGFLAYLIGCFTLGYKVVVPIVVALKTKGRVSRLVFGFWLFVMLIEMAGILNYMYLIHMSQEGFRWASEVHMVLRLLPVDVAEGYWIGVVRLALWLSIAVLFIRKCRRLKKAEQQLQSVAS